MKRFLNLLLMGVCFLLSVNVFAEPVEEQSTITEIEIKEDYDLISNLYNQILVSNSMLEHLGDNGDRYSDTTVEYLLLLEPTIDYSIELVKTVEAEQVLLYLKHIVNQLEWEQKGMLGYNEETKSILIENCIFWHGELLNKNDLFENVMDLIAEDLKGER